MRRAFLLVAASLLAQPLTAVAQPTWGGSVSLATNHLLRGISRSSNDPSLSAELHAQGASGWFAGVWTATSRPRGMDDTALDVAASLGLGGLFGERLSWRGTWSHYESPWQRNARWYRYNELSLDLQLRDVLLLSASWSPDTSVYSPYTGATPRVDAFAGEISARRALDGGLYVHGGAGWREYGGSVDTGYAYGSVGIGWNGRQWGADLSYVHPARAARHVAWPQTARRRLLLSVTRTF